MSDFINKTSLAEDVYKAIDRNLKGKARRIYIDSYAVTQELVIEFTKAVEAALQKRFNN